MPGSLVGGRGGGGATTQDSLCQWFFCRAGAEEYRLLGSAESTPHHIIHIQHSTTAARVHGAILQADLPDEPTADATSYSVDLRDGQGKLIWSTTLPASSRASDQDRQFSVYLPGTTLKNGAYSLSVTAVDAQGRRALVEEYVFDIVVSNQ